MGSAWCIRSLQDMASLKALLLPPPQFLQKALPQWGWGWSRTSPQPQLLQGHAPAPVSLRQHWPAEKSPGLDKTQGRHLSEFLRIVSYRPF